MKIRECAKTITMTSILSLVLSVPAFAQSPTGHPVLTASLGSPVAGSSNPSGFTFAPPTPSASPAAVTASAGSGILGFQAWKQLQVEDSSKALERMQSATPGLSKLSAAELAKNPKLQRLDQRIRQLQLNREVAQELTLNDYFLIYLSQFKSKEQLTEAAKHLTPEEVGELLLAYQRSSVRADQVDAPANGLLSGVNRPSTRSGASAGANSNSREAQAPKESRTRVN